MKTKSLLSVTFSLLFPMTLIFSQNEVWIENKYTPTDNSQASPHCVVFNDINEYYYVYTGQKIIIVNSNDGAIIDDIHVGETAYYCGFQATKERTNKLAFDHDNNYIYCANEDDQVLVIDCNNNHQKIHTFLAQFPLVSSYILFDSYNHKLFWVQNNINTIAKSRLMSFSTETFTNEGMFETSTGYRISDLNLCYHDEYQYLAVAVNRISFHSGGIYLLTPENLTYSDYYDFTDYEPNKLLYIEESNRILCLTTRFDNSILEPFSINLSSGQLNYLSSYSIPNFPIYSSESACYDIGYHYAYFSGITNSNDSKIVIIDYTKTYSQNPIVIEYILFRVSQVVYSPASARVFSSGDLLTKFYGSQIESSVSINGTSNHLIVEGNHLVLTNISGHTLDKYTDVLEPIYYAQVGDFTLKGCLNPTYDKIYWIGEPSDRPESFITIEHLSDNSITILPVGPGISENAYHLLTNKLIVSYHNYSQSSIAIIDGEDDQLDQVIPSEPVDVILPRSNNYTCLGGFNLLNVLNMTDYSISAVQNNGLSLPYKIDDFVLLNSGNILALAEENNYNGCKLLHIDRNSNQVINSYSYFREPIINKPLYYNPYKNQIYLLSAYAVTVINALNFITAHVIYPDDPIDACSYSQRSNKIILVSNGYQKIFFYDGTTFNSLGEVSLSTNEVIISSGYNPENDKLYLHIFKYDWMDCKNELRLITLRCIDQQICGDIYLEQNNIDLYFGRNPHEELLFDESYNYLYIPNQGIVNISKVKCSSDDIILNPGDWSWLSFPRLDRPPQGDPTVDEVLHNNIEPTGYMDYSQLRNHPFDEEGEVYNDYLLNYWNPTGQLEFINSALGYKIKLNYDPQPDKKWILLTGELFGPEEYVNVSHQCDSWVGYWLQETQKPFDAIPVDALDKLYKITAQNWFCVKELPPEPYPDGGPYHWTCGCHSEGVWLNYGDMVIFSAIRGVDQNFSFQWQQSGNPPSLEDRPSPEYFQYIEQAGYTPYLVEPDTTGAPQEIAAFVNDTCVGATALFPGDTLVLIPGYTGGMSGEVYFQQYYGNTKSAQEPIQHYFVMNNETRVKEYRSIHTLERKDYFRISFEPESGARANEQSTLLRCIPNPSRGSCRIEYNIPEDCIARLYVVDLLGKKLFTLHEGMCKSGRYSLQYNNADDPGNELLPGIYIIVLEAGIYRAEDKILITR